MKFTSLFLAIAALSSCVAKPWMVGSVNDHYKMHAYAAGKGMDVPDPGETPEQRAKHHKEKPKKYLLDPIGRTSSSNPLKP